MVKYSSISNPKFTIKLKMPLKTLLFWHKKMKEYINILKEKKKNGIEYPTIYISKKYPQIGFLELYNKIKNYFKRQILLNYMMRKNGNRESSLLSSMENGEINHIEEKDIIIRRKYESENIKHINEMNCFHIKHLFEAKSYKNSEGYDNCFVKIIVCRKKKKKKLESSIDNKNDNFSTTSLLSSSTNTSNKINLFYNLIEY